MFNHTRVPGVEMGFTNISDFESFALVVRFGTEGTVDQIYLPQWHVEGPG